MSGTVLLSVLPAAEADDDRSESEYAASVQRYLVDACCAFADRCVRACVRRHTWERRWRFALLCRARALATHSLTCIRNHLPPWVFY